MATVYLARDLKHDRQVALKVLKPELGAVLGVERFLSEIKVTANLQHPNLLPLFDSGEAAGLLFYVMPFVEGESLRVRLDREKQLPVDEAVRITVAIAGALAYAHDHGVIHRDLKPENILMQAGQPVIADFGIALAVSNAGGARVTQTGLSLGTPQYMSPEQAAGDRVVDGRSDLYSLGAMLYEMLTGDPPHTGSSVQAVIAKVITDRPRPVRELRHTVPVQVELAVEVALAKLPADRFANAAEFASALQGKADLSTRTGYTTAQASGAHGVRRSVVAGLAALLAVTAGLAAWGWSRPAPVPPPVVRMMVPTGRVTAELPALRISADGSLLLFSGRDSGPTASGLFSRKLREEAVTRVAGIGTALSTAALSSDGQWMVAWNVVTRELMKVPATGGARSLLATTKQFSGAAWVGNEQVAFIDGQKLYCVSASGGTPRLIAGKAGSAYSFPHSLPDGKTILVARRDSGRVAQLVAVALADGHETLLGVNGQKPFYVDRGFIVFFEQGQVRAIQFDAWSLRTSGEAVTIVEQVASSPFSGFANPAFAVSRSGTVLYATGAVPGTELVVTDRSGQGAVLPIPPGNVVSPRFSPDGRRLAFSEARFDGELSVFDFVSKRVLRLTTDSASSRPEWTPDGRALVHVHMKADRSRALYRILADGSAEAQPFFARAAVAPLGPVESRLTPDGRAIIFREDAFQPGVRDILIAPVDSPTAARPLAATAANERGLALSADGKWLAFVSDRSGTDEVYLRRIADGSAQWKVSTNGGVEPRWGAAGRELLYRGRDSVFSVAVTLGAEPTFALPKGLLLDGFLRIGHEPYWDVSSDGKRFVFVRSVQKGGVTLHLLMNWFAQPNPLQQKP